MSAYYQPPPCKTRGGWSLTPLHAGRLNPFSIIIFIILIYMTQNAFAFIVVVGCAFRAVPCLACRDFCLLMLRLLAATSGKRRETAGNGGKRLSVSLCSFSGKHPWQLHQAEYIQLLPRQACFSASHTSSLFAGYLTVIYTFLLVTLINVWRNKFLLT